EEGLGTLLGTADTLLYEQLDYTLYGIHSMAKVVNTFVPIFELVMVFLCAGAVFVLVIFASKMINGKMHEIGILKALGTQNSTVGKIFGLQVGLIAALSCVLTTVGYYFTVGLTNTLLIESLHAYASTWVIPDLDFLVFKPEIAVFNCLLTFALSAVALVIPLIKIKSIKPVKIIKAKE
ncbi:MAG: hypothetical protein IKT81_00760, partial [Clostridia bacterium]|nr:hypothetical protein [Clostridia bacterium]